ncbi:MAG: hypothetical protein IPL61_28980 [Myxococcales bacterium]|nr:hypothetical protein [Myxococcales bacterium]
MLACRTPLALVAIAAVACGPAAAPRPATAPVVTPQPPPVPAPAPDVGLGPPPAVTLDDDVTPVAYRLDLALDPSATTYAGVVEIDVTLARPTRAIWLHADRRITVDAATARRGTTTLGALTQARPGPPRTTRESLLGLGLPAAATGALTLRLEFSAPYGDRVGIFAQRSGDDRFVYSDFEPADARAAFPCFDEPRWRTPFAVVVRTPDGVAAYANMPTTGTTREGDWLVHQFEPTPPLPTYLVAVAAGRFTAVDVPGAPVPARLIAPPALAHVEQARAVLGPIVTTSTRWLGRPWPWPKLDVIVVPSLSGAMENPGLITIAASIATGAVHADERALVALVLAHEVAHAWFGTVVTPRTWRELWLNEGLATWMSDRVLRELPTPTRAATDHVLDRLEVIAEDQADLAHALRPATIAHPRALLDGLTYQKGAALMHAWAAWLGDAPVRAALGAYLDRHAGQVVDSDDLIAELARLAPELPIAAVATDGLTRAGAPAVVAERLCLPGRALVRVTATDHRVTPVCVRWSGGRACAVVDDVATIELGATCPAWLTADAGGDGYYRWQLVGGDWAALAVAPLTPAERVSALEAVVDGVVAGTATRDDLVATLTAAIATGDAGALAAAAPWLGIVDAASADRARPALARVLHAATDRALAHLGRAAIAAEPDARADARARALELAGVAGDDRAAVRWARRTVASWRRGAALPAAVIGPALVIAAHRGNARARAQVLAIARRDDARTEPLAPYLGRALTALPDATLYPLVIDGAQLPLRVRVEAMGALLERPDRAATIAPVLAARVGPMMAFATTRPCQAPPPALTQRPYLAAVAARCQTLAARLTP